MEKNKSKKKADLNKMFDIWGGEGEGEEDGDGDGDGDEEEDQELPWGSISNKMFDVWGWEGESDNNDYVNDYHDDGILRNDCRHGRGINICSLQILMLMATGSFLRRNLRTA